MKKLFLTISILLIAVRTYALTAEEAKKAYQALSCEITNFTESGHASCAQCHNLTDLIVYYDVSWDSEAPTPEPTPEPEPTPTPCPVPEPCPPCPTEPVCVPEWCSLPVQDCTLPPLTGGTDSCGAPCSKPSPEWPNCLDANGNMVVKDFSI